MPIILTEVAVFKFATVGAIHFEDFLADVGPRPSSDHSLDRYPDPNGNYEPSNIRRATRVEQGRNRSNNLRATLNGHNRTVVEWVEERQLDYNNVRSRIARGMTPEEALTKPFRSRKRRERN